MKGLSQESRALIDAARDGDNPTAHDRRRVRAAVGRKLAMGAAAGAVAVTATHTAAGSVAAGTGAATGAVTTAAAGAGVAGAGAGTSIAAGALASGLGAKFVVSVAIVGALGAGTVSYVKHQAATRDVSTSSVAVAPSTPAFALGQPKRPAEIRTTFAASAATPSASSSAPLPVAARDESAPALAAANDPPLSRPQALAPANPSPSSPAPGSDLTAELSLLQDVHGALKGGDGARALALLDEHDRRFPAGQLGEESQAARVFALCALGRVEDARGIANRFLRQHARSPLAARVARACDAETTPF